MRNLTKLFALLLALMMIVPAAMAEETLRGYDKKEGYVYVTLGTFPQTAEGGEKPIIWRVLSVKDSRAYILSEYVLLAHRMHGDYTEYANKPTAKKNPGFGGDFSKTELSLYMNGEFAAHFTAGELALLTPHETMGTFFLVTADDLKDKALGFGTNQSRKAWATDYARENGLFVYGSKYGKHSPYWTCDQSTSDDRHARCTKDQGELGRINVITEDLGMRPACYLDMTKVVIASGDGTLENPYVLVTEAAAPVETAETPVPAAENAPCCQPDSCSCCTSCTCGCQ